MKQETGMRAGFNAPKYFIGIGASAGGLEALQDFFKNLGEDLDAAYIVIQHLAPDYKSMMDELLSRFTNLAIKKIVDGQSVEARTIYLIPPAHNVTIFHGVLYLQPHTVQRTFNLPVDVFLRSLANDQEKQAVAVILSGTGSDGTLGVKAVKEMGGMVLVQDEETAKFNGMPRNAVATGLVDFILPPAKMGEAIKNYLTHPFITEPGKSSESIALLNIDTMAKILLMLRDASGIDFSFYKENTIARRIERRIGIKRMRTIEEYLILLMESDEEKNILYKELLIGVTRFFRDADAFAALREKVLPSILKQGAVVRLWSAGCSTGEEVYSLAIVCLDYIKRHNLSCDLKIFATDVDKRALEIASQGYYPANIAADMDADLLATYFIRQDEGFQITEDVRRLVVFAVHNILKDPPFSRIDLVTCRNLFIYLKGDVQQQVLSMFFHALSQEGFLFMGSSESIGEMSEAFKTVDVKHKLYRRDSSYKPKLLSGTLPLSSPSTETLSSRGPGQVLVKGRVFERLLESTLSAVLPPSVIVDEHDNIVHVINNMHMFMEIRPGRFSQNLLSNIPQDLALFVNNVLRRLKDGDNIVEFENITGIERFAAKRISLVGRVVRLENKNFYHISFEAHNIDATQKADESNTSVEIEQQVGKRIQELERSLQLTKENLQATVEELETSNEELQSSNEELIASNEELQSTNEELQAVNEELYSVNAEYQQKIDELIRTTNDLDNLIKNTEIGALYLDKTLCIRKVTPAVSKVANIYTTDVGRPITHFTFKSNTEAMMEGLQKVLETLQPLERELEDSQGNVWLSRIRPYRTAYNAVDGIMLVFVDITQRKVEEKQHKLVQGRMEEAMRLGKMAWWMIDIPKDSFDYDPMLLSMLDISEQEAPQCYADFLSLVHPDDRLSCSQAFDDLAGRKQSEVDLSIRLRSGNGKFLYFACHANASEEYTRRKPTKLFGTLSNITELKDLKRELEVSSDNFQVLSKMNSPSRVAVDVNGLVTYMSDEAASLWGQSASILLGKHFDSLFLFDGKSAESGPHSILLQQGQLAGRQFSIISQTSLGAMRVLVQGFAFTSKEGEAGSLFIVQAMTDAKEAHE